MSDAPKPAYILLLSDDLMTVSRVREAAARLGYAVAGAATPEAAQAKAVEDRPIAIFVSLTLRRGDPFAFIRSVKADDSLKSLPLLAFAGHVEIEKHDRARSAGADKVAANSSVALHLDKLLPRLLLGSENDFDDAEEA